MNNEQYEIIEESKLEELDSLATFLRHKQTGAEILHLHNTDENKVFGVSFRTPIWNSTGLPHILEHSVLCGSEKYPSKEPFVELIKGSLYTFLNAMTYTDKTCYPVASQNEKDFFNLVDVYLDAVFFPFITKETLMQEGWHYHLENESDLLKYKGVVFNEMKGEFSSPSTLLYQHTVSALNPDTNFFFCSGGDPKNIPELSYSEFKKFHSDFYHPSNSKIYFYGDVELDRCLTSLEDYLSKFEKSKPDSEIPVQKFFNSPKTIKETYDPGNAEPKSYVQVSWLFKDLPLPEEVYEYYLIDYLLVGSSASFLTKALLESGLGEGLTGGGLLNHTRQPSFMIGLKGVKAENREKVEKLIFDTLANIEVDEELLASAINSIEFILKENNSGRYPKGLSAMLDSLTFWLHDRDPLEILRFEKPFKKVKGKCEADKTYLFKKAKDLLLNNHHRVSVFLDPEKGKTEKLEKEEQEKLTKYKNSLSEKEIKDLVEQTQKLMAKQDAPDTEEDLAKIPSLELSEIDKKNKQIPIEEKSKEDYVVLHHDLFTNNIFYFDMVLNFSAVKEELLPLMPLYCSSLTALGTENYSYTELAKILDRDTGGLSVAPLVMSQKESKIALTKVMMRAKCLPEKIDQTFDIINEIFEKPSYKDRERFLTLTKQRRAGLENAMNSNGHRAALGRLTAKYTQSAYISECFSGVSQLTYLRKLEKRVEDSWESVVSDLKELHATISAGGKPIFNLTFPEKHLTSFESQISSLSKLFTEAPKQKARWKEKIGQSNECFKIPSNVNYVASAANMYELGYEYSGTHLAIKSIIATNHLWNQVRVLGGAYGAFCSFDKFTGLFTFASYRDPNISKTLDAYNATSEFLCDAQISDSEIKKSIIGAIGSIDDYKLPDAKGYVSLIRYLLNVSVEERQVTRDELLAFNSKDLKIFGEKLANFKESSKIVVFGSEELLKEANLGCEIQSIF